jgi:cytochrome c biogenesis protein CcmG, thiol:disulfide interchange protein DsbE
MNHYARLMPLIILLGFVVICGIGLSVGKIANPSRSPLIGKPLSFFSLPSFPDPISALTSRTWKGKVAIVNIFASWCESCNTEHPVLMKLAESRKVEIYGIAWKERPEDLSRWLNSKGNPYQKIGIDNSGRTTMTFGLTGVPETFVIDKSGAVAYHTKSALTEDMVNEEILPLVEKLQANSK